MTTLDTSGVVKVTRKTMFGDTISHGAIWSDLSPFAQGYVEAAVAGFHGWFDVGYKSKGFRPVGFSDLAPEALAMILRDCDRWIQLYPATGRGTANGARLWELRNLQLITPTTDFPPLCVYLNDAGKVMLEVAQRRLDATLAAKFGGE